MVRLTSVVGPDVSRIVGASGNPLAPDLASSVPPDATDCGHVRAIDPNKNSRAQLQKLIDGGGNATDQCRHNASIPHSPEG